MTLGEKQRRFTKCIGMLIGYAYTNGYELTFGDAYRDPRLHGGWGEKKGYGAARSVHKVRLAVDLNLFKDGKWLQDSADHKFLGQYWKDLDPSARWGGDFEDGNHYSFEHEGCK